MTQINIRLSSEIVEELKSLVIALAQSGEIRATTNNQYSVFDVIRNAGEQKSEREVWKRLTVNHPEVVTACDNLQFPGKGQRKTPVAALDTCIYIINLLPGEIGEKMRQLSAKITAQVVEQTADSANVSGANSAISVTQMFALMRSQNQQIITAMMQIQQENNRQIQSILSVLTQLVAEQPKNKPQLEGAKSSNNPPHRLLIDDVIDEQMACRYSKMWVKHALSKHSVSSDLTKSDWLYCAKKLGYKPGWGYYCYNETQHGKKNHN